MNAPRPPAYRLRLPGPVAVPERVLRALAEPMVDHRGPEFRAVFQEINRLAQSVLRTTAPVFLLAGSGTAAMEAAIANVVAPGDRVLAVVEGSWGERMRQIAAAYGATVDAVEAEWGQSVPPAAILARLDQADYRAVLICHNESSTGAVADLAALGAALRDRPTLLVVDAVSSAGGMPLEIDGWGLDVVFTGSQKALMNPPGLGLVAVGPKAWPVIERPGASRFYFDFRKARAALDKDETPFTPAVTLARGLLEALRMIEAEGLEAVIARHRRLARALRTGAEALGLGVFTRAPLLSSTVTALELPAGIDAAPLRDRLRTGYGTVVAGSRNRLAGRVIRIGTMGAIDDADILTDLVHLEAALRDLGHRVEPGAGIAAAAAALAAAEA